MIHLLVGQSGKLEVEVEVEVELNQNQNLLRP
jgi:hypothetical protein